VNTIRKADTRIGGLAAICIATMLVALSTLVPSPARGQTASPDFSLAPTRAGEVLNLGYLVRGGLQLCTANCFDGLVEPKAQSCLPDYTCTTPIWVSTDIQVISANGFLGTVNLEVLNLPPGVTSLMPASVTIVEGSGFPPLASTAFSLKADSTATLGTFTVTLRATSGSIIHAIDYQITVADALPPLSSDGQLGFFAGIQLDSQFVSGAWPNAVGGTSTTGLAWVTGGGAAPGGVTVALTSSDPAIATVSPSVLTIPEGVSIGRFTVSTAPVTAPVYVWISGTDGTTTSAASLGVWPPDSVSVKLAQYDKAKGQLSIEATTTACSGCGFSTATLTAFVTATGETIGIVPQIDIGKYKGQLAWPVNPQTITVKSNQGGAATVAVAAK
jgi:hypothetical protein